MEDLKIAEANEAYLKDGRKRMIAEIPDVVGHIYECLLRRWYFRKAIDRWPYENIRSWLDMFQSVGWT